MDKNNTQRAVILLQDGTIFYGRSCGAIGTISGEIAFNTGMTGYQEIFTDPSYFGQILIMATSHIGNYGVHKEEIESKKCKIKGLIVKKFSKQTSRYGNVDSLQNYLKRDNVVGIQDVDTRALVIYVRENGAQNAIISSENTNIDELKKLLDNSPSMLGTELASKVSTASSYTLGNGSHKIALIDYGVKNNIISCLLDRNCIIKVFPYNTSSEEILLWGPEGIMLSNGPGDPEPLTECIETVKELVDTDIPIFGICLGHQILCLSQGLKTEKMYNGHRGINHPVKNLKTGKCEITSQNHGFVVSHDGVKDNSNLEITHRHLNDNTIAGIALKNKKISSVQYHPESSPGPHDSRYLFDDFLENIKTYKKQLI